MSALKTLIRFAGDDQPARLYGGEARRVMGQDASTMFRLGADTASIAGALDMSEAKVLKRVTLERCKRLGLPNPYEAEQ